MRQENENSGTGVIDTYVWDDPELKRVRRVVAFQAISIQGERWIVNSTLPVHELSGPLESMMTMLIGVMILYMMILAVIMVFFLRNRFLAESQLSYLKQLFSEAISLPEICALSIGTRPDCLPDETVELLSRLNKEKPVWIELGLQTIHEDTAKLIRRGYALPVFEDAYRRLKAAGLTVIVHVILGLPGESREQMLETVNYLGKLHVDGIKLQLLHVLKGTDLADLYASGKFQTLELPEYLELIGDCLKILPQETVIHRISGDGPKSILIAPEWSGNKRLVLNSIAKYLKEHHIFQGMDL